MDDPIVVLDNGGCTIKAGMAGEEEPVAVVPNIIGMEQFHDLTDGSVFENFIEAHKKGELKLRHPISKGSVTKWEDMELVWQTVFDKHLQVNPEETSILITEPISNPKPAREKMAEILFEKLNFKAVSIATSPILPLYAAGRTTGIVLNVGDGTTQVVPVWGGYPITEAMKRVNVGGHDITQFFKDELVNRKNLHATATMPIEVFKLIKEKTCYVVPDYEKVENQASSSKSFELPNGEKIEVGDEAYKSPEFLFSPLKFDDESDMNRVGLPQLVYKAIMKANIDVRKDLYANIVLSGGSTLFPGFAERMEKELKALAPPSVKINVIAHPTRQYFTWIGGSVMASLNSFPDTLITKQCWEDGSGRKAIGKLCS